VPRCLAQRQLSNIISFRAIDALLPVTGGYSVQSYMCVVHPFDCCPVILDFQLWAIGLCCAPRIPFAEAYQCEARYWRWQSFPNESIGGGWPGRVSFALFPGHYAHQGYLLPRRTSAQPVLALVNDLPPTKASAKGGRDAKPPRHFPATTNLAPMVGQGRMVCGPLTVERLTSLRTIGDV
jgi:hypothetical protein